MSSTEKSAASVDADALARALKDVKDVGRPRQRTPGTSPSRKRQRIYGDRQVAELSFTVQSHVGAWMSRGRRASPARNEPKPREG